MNNRYKKHLVSVSLALLALGGCMAMPLDAASITQYNDKLLTFYGQLLGAVVQVVGLVIGLIMLNKKAVERAEVGRKLIDNKLEEYNSTITDVTGEAVTEARQAIRDMDKKLGETQVMLAAATTRKVRSTDIVIPTRETPQTRDLPS